MPAHLSVASHLNDLIDSTESNIPGEMLSLAKPQEVETPLDGAESTPDPVTEQRVKSTFAMRDSRDHDEGEG